jgi:putative endonuclease
MPTDARRTLGKQGEDLAVAHLERLGYEILGRNHRTRFGELDVVATEGDSIVFVEVKTRRAGSGRPWDSLHDLKRAQVRRMAAAWLNQVQERPFAAELRFDAIGVVVDGAGALVELEHLVGAF